MSGAAASPAVALVDVIVALSQLIERHADDAVQVRVLAAAIGYLMEGLEGCP